MTPGGWWRGENDERVAVRADDGDPVASVQVGDRCTNCVPPRAAEEDHSAVVGPPVDDCRLADE